MEQELKSSIRGNNNLEVIAYLHRAAKTCNESRAGGWELVGDVIDLRRSEEKIWQQPSLPMFSTV
jgi:hypothetical protein